MKIAIQAIGLEVTHELESFIVEALRVLPKQPPAVVRAEIILGEDVAGEEMSVFCNIRLITTGTGYLVAQPGASWKHAVAGAVNQLVRKMKSDDNR